MQQKIRAERPKCSRPLQKFNGHIGYCSQYKWVSPTGLGYEAEAVEWNYQDAAVAFFVVRPSVSYRNAINKFASAGSGRSKCSQRNASARKRYSWYGRRSHGCRKE